MKESKPEDSTTPSPESNSSDSVNSEKPKTLGESMDNICKILEKYGFTERKAPPATSGIEETNRYEMKFVSHPRSVSNPDDAE